MPFAIFFYNFFILVITMKIEVSGFEIYCCIRIITAENNFHNGAVIFASA